MTSPDQEGTRRIRVLLSAPMNSVGGQAHAARDIIEGFERHPEVTVRPVAIDPQLPGPLGFLTRTKGVRSVVKPALYTAALLRHTRRADVVHVFCAAHLAFLFGAMPAVLVAILFRKPVILNYHDGRAEAHLLRWGPLVRWAVRRSRMLVVPSGYLVDIFAAHGISATVVPNVVDTRAFPHRPQETPAPRMVSTRALEDLYGIDNTIRAFALVRKEIPHVTCDVYGGGSMMPLLQDLAAELGEEGIHFHGEIAHERVPEVLAAGGILVNSSRVDNMPHVLVEASASGLPIVTTDVGGIPYMVENEVTALLVPPDQPGLMASAVLRMLRDPDLARRLAGTAYEACSNYTWNRARTLWVTAYKRTAGTSPPSP